MVPRKFLHVSGQSATPIGDIREADAHCVVVVYRNATNRRDWSRYWEAIGVAYVRGAQVVTT